ncbi:MAG: hypothetical protein LBQ63_00915 [Deltaproteobacteria bacterium]|jgi:hypothetical protein|nr:hypothetical protein [Deltaproteobacteria bacterium]
MKTEKKSYPFEFIVDEHFFRSNQRKETVMLIVNGSTHIVHIEGYIRLPNGRYKLYGSPPPPGKENYRSIIYLQNIQVVPDPPS